MHWAFVAYKRQARSATIRRGNSILFFSKLDSVELGTTRVGTFSMFVKFIQTQFLQQLTRELKKNCTRSFTYRVDESPAILTTRLIVANSNVATGISGITFRALLKSEL